MTTAEESELRRRVRLKLTTNRLPQSDPIRTWAGPGSGQQCVVCEQPIATTHTEYELQFGHENGDGLRFHRECQAVWDAERRQP